MYCGVVPRYVVSDAAQRLFDLLTLVAERGETVEVCFRDTENVIAILEPVADVEGLVSVALTDARDRFSSLVNAAAAGADPVVITRHRKPMAVLSKPPTASTAAVAVHAAGAETMSAQPRRRRPPRERMDPGAIAAALLKRFPATARPPHHHTRERLFRIFGPLCLLGNHTSYRPVIQCAHVNDWNTTVAAYAASDWQRSLVEHVASHPSPNPKALQAVEANLAVWFNEITNVIPLCEHHHKQYDGVKRTANPPTREGILEKRSAVLLLPDIAMNVMRELEAACYGRLSRDADHRPVITGQWPSNDHVTLYLWAAKAWKHGSLGDAAPEIRIGEWRMNLASRTPDLTSNNRILDETPKFWWAGYR